MTSFVRDLFSLLGLVVVMVIQQPAMSLVAFVFGPIAIYLVNRLLKQARRIMEKEFLSVSKIVEVMQETVFGVRIVKSFNLEGSMQKRMYKAVADVERRSNSIAALEAVTSPIMETLAGLAIAGVIVVSGYLVIQGGQTPGSVMSFITALLLAYEPAKRLARARVSLETGMVGVRMMYDISDRPLSLVEAPDAKPLSAGAGEIRFENVNFSYRDEEAVLQRPQSGLSGRPDDGAGRRFGWRQIDDPEPHHAALRSGQRPRPVRRRRYQACDAAFAARQDRLCQPGHVPVLGHGHAQYPHGPPGRDRRRGDRGRQGRQRARLHHWPCRRATRR